jgi:Cu/Ag efflux protein CusF
MQRIIFMLVLLVAFAASAAAFAQTALSDGEVRRVDKAAGKVTLRHGPIPSIDMPPMTMVFQVKDPTLLEQVRTGDKVKFAAEKDGSNYVVTTMEVVK